MTKKDSYEIHKCCWAECPGWVVQTYHSPTGQPWDDKECPHFKTKKEAERYLTEEKEAGRR